MVKPQPESPTRGEPSGGPSKYKGVRKRKWGKWVSEIRLPNSRERIWLGSYDSPEKAARAFDAAQYCLRGSDVKFNFPDNPPDIAGARSLSPLEIQAFASRFANESSTSNTSSNNYNVGMTTQQYTYSPSISVSVSDHGGAAIQVESSETVDWSSFLSMLDTNQAMSDYGFYPGLGDQFYPPPVYDNVDGDGDGFPQHSSFLWNFSDIQ
ncbi:ERF015 protein [Hibiscus syriacus]|uniref:ERF015 protein n=1 Tax=Hibiscus syriacus TaxID=106335 RepID=A0A6A2YIB7_HIBSY|nr:ethylene-responsive transcription factor ERF017-like [Hibiscus syriacus]KAE8675064.1 ERF015 protein [Hibiscus syriacus]